VTQEVLVDIRDLTVDYVCVYLGQHKRIVRVIEKMNMQIGAERR
jgi:hypothetical protein